MGLMHTCDVKHNRTYRGIMVNRKFNEKLETKLALDWTHKCISMKNKDGTLADQLINQEVLS